MQKIGVQYLKPGMIIAKTILNSDGKVLLSEGMIIKEHYLEKFLDLGITEVYIKSLDSEEMIANDVIRDRNRIEANKIVKETLDKISMGREFSTQQIYETVNLILEDLLNNNEIMVNLSEIRDVDDYTFCHSVNVSVLSLITGIAMGYDKEMLKRLGVGAILHDIGKVLIPHEILNKPGSLSELEFNHIKKHTEIGYNIIQKYSEIHSDSMEVIFQHHERYNGSGYPRGKQGNEIHEFARIVAIADVYDALTSDRVYKKKILPHEAIEYLVSMGNHDFDYDIVKKFTLHVASYPLGTVVLLSSGIQGVVVGNDKNYPNRPKIRCILDERGIKFNNSMDLELVNHPSITITKVVQNIS